MRLTAKGINGKRLKFAEWCVKTKLVGSEKSAGTLSLNARISWGNRALALSGTDFKL